MVAANLVAANIVAANIVAPTFVAAATLCKVTALSNVAGNLAAAFCWHLPPEYGKMPSS
jgi:hypothetical protein